MATTSSSSSSSKPLHRNSQCYVCAGVINPIVNSSSSPCVATGGSADGGVAVTGVPSSAGELLVQAVTPHLLSSPSGSLSRLHGGTVRRRDSLRNCKTMVLFTSILLNLFRCHPDELNAFRRINAAIPPAVYREREAFGEGGDGFPLLPGCRGK